MPHVGVGLEPAALGEARAGCGLSSGCLRPCTRSSPLRSRPIPHSVSTLERLRMSDAYIVITADTHAGNSIAGYRSTSTRASGTSSTRGLRNPSKKHIGGKKAKNWDAALRRGDLLDDGVVGEVIFPNTVPPFYDKAFHVAPPATPQQYRRFRAGTRAHNRWLADFCQEDPAARAGIGLIHLNDIDDAIEDVAWIAENGLRGGVLLPLPAPSDVHLPQLNDRSLDRLWAAIQDHDLVESALGSGCPTLGRAGSNALWAMEMTFYSARLHDAHHGGVFERFPGPVHPDRERLRLGARRLVRTWTACTWREDGRDRDRHRTTCPRSAPQLLREAQLLVRRELPESRGHRRR